MPTPDPKRYGPTALITGASDGIGRAFAMELASQGYGLVLVARRAAVLQALAEELTTRHSVPARVIAADLGEAAEVGRVLAETAGDDIGLLVAAAGFGSSGAFLDLDAGSEAGMVDVNCRAVVTLTHGMAGRMAARGRGGIVLFGSLVGFQGAPYSATYAATKGFVQGFAEALRVELRPRGVEVLSVAPGPIASGFAVRAGMVMAQSQTPDVVAKGALAALGRQGTVRPGWLSKFLGWSLAMMPRWGRVIVMGKIMAGMAKGTRG